MIISGRATRRARTPHQKAGTSARRMRAGARRTASCSSASLSSSCTRILLAALALSTALAFAAAAQRGSRKSATQGSAASPHSAPHSALHPVNPARPGDAHRTQHRTHSSSDVAPHQSADHRTARRFSRQTHSADAPPTERAAPAPSPSAAAARAPPVLARLSDGLVQGYAHRLPSGQVVNVFKVSAVRCTFLFCRFEKLHSAQD